MVDWSTFLQPVPVPAPSPRPAAPPDLTPPATRDLTPPARRSEQGQGLSATDSGYQGGIRAAVELERELADAEARIAALEHRRRQGELAEAAYQAARGPTEAAYRAFQRAQGSFFARAAALIGLGPLAKAERALGPLQERFKTAMAGLEGAKAAFATAEQRASGLDLVVQQLRDELVSTREVENRHDQAVGFLIAAITRLDAAIGRGDPRREDWAALRLLDMQPRRFDVPQIQALAAVLRRDPGLATAISYELGERRAEIDSLEAEAVRYLEHDDDQAP